MKILSRDFTLKEKLLLLMLSLILVGLAYYKFVDQPVRTALASAKAEETYLSTELTTVNARLAQLRRMRTELDSVTANSSGTVMGSYNNSKEEIASLNEILKDTSQYSISFANVTRNGDQIRRSFSLSFTVDDYEMLEHVMDALSSNQYRCLIGDLSCSGGKDILDGKISANTTATFFETMVGGTPDAGLPASSAAAR